MTRLVSHPLNILLAMVLLALGVAIVHQTHQHRQNTIALRNAKQTLNQLQSEHARLRLEHSTLSDYKKIKHLAETSLNLRTPMPEQYVRATQ